MTLVTPRRLTAVDLAALPLPLRLNTAQIAGEGAGAGKETLGTLQFAPEFLRRLEAAVRAELWEDHLPYSEWHRSPYVVARLAQVVGWPVLQAIMARRRAVRDLEDDQTYQAMDDWREYRPYREERLEAAAAPYGMTGRQVERAERQIMGLVRGRLMSYRPSYAWRRSSQQQPAPVVAQSA